MSEAQAEPIILANWGRRFIAWFIDYLLVNVMLAYFRLETIETQLLPAFLLPRIPGFDISVWSPLSILIFFLYWTLSGWYFGRSIGQLILNIRLVDLKGKNARISSCAVQSIGKSFGFFLLPFDCLIGWAYRPSREIRQRYFNRLSGTIVSYIGKPMRTVTKGEYKAEI
jgi:uncharacterized RDD family membrane protein YckC